MSDDGMEYALSLAEAWLRVEKAVRATPHAYSVRITSLLPIRGYAARVELEYKPTGHKRNRTDRVDGEGETVAVALNELATGLEGWAPR